MKILQHRFKAFMLVYLAVLLFYLFSLQQNFSSSHDAITYLVHITEGKELFHPHHLLYNASAWAWLKGLSAFLPNIPDYYLVEAFSAFWGSGIILLCYLFFTGRFGKRSRYAALASTVIAFSYGIWCYSTNVEVYAPSIFFSLWILYVLTGEKQERKDIYKISILHIAAILFHQVNILLLPVILLAMYFRTDRRRYLRDGLIYITVTGLTSLGVYLAAGILIVGKNTPSTFWSWMTYYATEQDYWHSPGISSILYAFTGFAHAFIGGHFVFRMPVADSLIRGGLESHGLTDEAFLVDSMTPGFAWLLMILSVCVALVMIYLLLNFLSRVKLLLREKGNIYIPLLSAFIVYSLFFVFWNPENLEFWIFQSVIAWLVLLGARESAAPRFFPLLPAVISTMLFIINFGGSMKWLQDKQYDWYYKQVEGPATISVDGDGILLEDPWIIDGYTRYFMKGERILPDEFLLKNLRARTDSGYKVFIFEGRHQPAPLADSLKKVFGERIMPLNDHPPMIYIFQ